MRWDSLNAYDEWSLLRRPLRQGYEAQEDSGGQGGLVSSLGREARREVALVSRLRKVLEYPDEGASVYEAAAGS